MDKFQNKYRITSSRLQSWDYGANGAYFITICTKNRMHYFGEITETLESNVYKTQLNEIGQLAEKYWMEIPNHFPFVKLGAFVVMPNHTHGILIIDKPVGGASVGNITSSVETLQCNASTANETTHEPTIITGKNEQMAKISPKSGTISTIIRSYKSVVSKNARKINVDFAWQSRFHDHIIRNTESFQKIETYIYENPEKWVHDKFHKH